MSKQTANTQNTKNMGKYPKDRKLLPIITNYRNAFCVILHAWCFWKVWVKLSFVSQVNQTMDTIFKLASFALCLFISC